MNFDTSSFNLKYEAWKNGADYWKDLRGIDLYGDDNSLTIQDASPSIKNLFWENQLLKQYYNSYDYQNYAGGKSGDSPSDNIYEFIKQWEGFNSVTKPDDSSKRIPTLGYGFTDPNVLKKYNNRMTKSLGYAELKNQVNLRYNRLSKIIPHWDEFSPKMKDAVVSYYYNYGNAANKNSKFYKYLKNRDYYKAVNEINAGWNQPGVSKGLRARRIAELKMFKSGIKDMELQNYMQVALGLQQQTLSMYTQPVDNTNVVVPVTKQILQQPVIPESVPQSIRRDFYSTPSLKLKRQFDARALYDLVMLNTNIYNNEPTIFIPQMQIGKDSFRPKFWLLKNNNMHL